MIQGADAAASLIRHADEIDKMLGKADRDAYIGLAYACKLHVLDIDGRGIMVFHDEDQDMCIDIVIGESGTIAEISRLQDVARKIGYHRIVAKTRNEGMRRIYKRHGMSDVECLDGEYKMVLELGHG